MALKPAIEAVASAVTLCIAVGVALSRLGYQAGEEAFFYLAAFMVLLYLVSLAWAPAGRLLEWVSYPVRWLLRKTWRATREAYVRIAVYLLRPVITRTLQEQGVSSSPNRSSTRRGGDQQVAAHVEESTLADRFGWTAHTWRLYPRLQRADYRTVMRPGYRLRSISFVVRPDYRHYHWKAGFRLGPADDNFQDTPIADRFLFHIGATGRNEATHAVLYWENNQDRQLRLPLGDGGLRPAFCIEANIWATPDEDASQIEISVDGEIFFQRRIPSTCAERVTLLAWGDGREFTVYFDSVVLHWLPTVAGEAGE